MCACVCGGGGGGTAKCLDLLHGEWHADVGIKQHSICLPQYEG